MIKCYSGRYSSTYNNLNGWKNSQVSGVEIQLTDFDSLEPLSDLIYQLVKQENTDGDKRYYAQTIRDMNPQIFGWLDLLI